MMSPTGVVSEPSELRHTRPEGGSNTAVEDGHDVGRGTRRDSSIMKALLELLQVGSGRDSVSRGQPVPGAFRASYLGRLHV